MYLYIVYVYIYTQTIWVFPWRGFLQKGFRAPLKGFGVDARQVFVVDPYTHLWGATVGA